MEALQQVVEVNFKMDTKKAENICIKAEAYARELLEEKLGKGALSDFFILISFDPNQEAFEVDIEASVPKAFNINLKQLIDNVITEVFKEIDKMVSEDC